MDNDQKFMEAHGMLSKQSYGSAFLLFQELSSNNYPVADHFLAWMYEQGLGTAPNPQKAFEHYLFSAKTGNGVSQHAVGLYYLEGKYIEQDVVKAYYWFSMATETAKKDPDSECGAKAELEKLKTKLTKVQLVEAQQYRP